jgi:hypothetical protein
VFFVPFVSGAAAKGARHAIGEFDDFVDDFGKTRFVGRDGEPFERGLPHPDVPSGSPGVPAPPTPRVANVETTLSALPVGRTGNVRVVASDADLNQVFQDLTTGGKPIQWTNYQGPVFEMPDGVQVGKRTTSSSGGATIDIRMPDGTMRKVHVQ